MAAPEEPTAAAVTEPGGEREVIIREGGDDGERE